MSPCVPRRAGGHLTQAEIVKGFEPSWSLEESGIWMRLSRPLKCAALFWKVTEVGEPWCWPVASWAFWERGQWARRFVIGV